MPRFVILTHDHPFRHWDLMLEEGPGLRTWRLTEAPQPGRAIAAERLPDHRCEYLDYEGPVSGGRGTVRRVDHGTYDVPVPSCPNRIRLRGARQVLNAELVMGADHDVWRFTGDDAEVAAVADAPPAHPEQSPRCS